MASSVHHRGPWPLRRLQLLQRFRLLQEFIVTGQPDYIYYGGSQTMMFWKVERQSNVFERRAKERNVLESRETPFVNGDNVLDPHLFTVRCGLENMSNLSS